MTEPTNNDVQEANEAIRKAFPLDEGMSAESTWRLHAQLRPAAEGTRRRRIGLALGLSLAASLAVAAGAYGVLAARPDVPEVTNVADRIEADYPNGAPVTPREPSAVPALALKAIDPSGKILHFTSKGETEFGPGAGETADEMWFDPKSGAGRLVRVTGSGKTAVTTVVISDGNAASVTTKKSGETPVARPADMSGRLGKSFDKLSAYRKMLESGAATVTAEGEIGDVKTYKLRAEIEGFGNGQVSIVMLAEIRADNHLPISYKSEIVDETGKTMRLSTRNFSTFETLDAGTLPSDWFTPSAEKTPSESSTSGIVDL